MALFTFGISHQSAPLSLRERCFIEPDHLASQVLSLHQHPDISEAVLLSTCNRTEVYAEATQSAPLINWLEQYSQLDQQTLLRHSYLHQDQQALRHGIRVGSGVDSMLLGEPQILGQIKKAYASACELETVGPTLNHTFPLIFSASKQVRHETQLSRCPLSLAHGLMKLAEATIEQATQARILLIGAGEMVKSMATYFKEMSDQKLCIATRDLIKAQPLANQFSAKLISLVDMPHQLNQSDMVIAATNSTEYLITNQMLQSLRYRPQLIVDLSMPRNIDPAVASVEGTQLYHLDELTQRTNAYLKKRQDASRVAEQMIVKLSQQFTHADQRQRVANIIRDYREHIQHISQQTHEEICRRYHVDSEQEHILKTFSHKLCQQIMHEPTVQLRQAALKNDTATITTLAQLFHHKDTTESC
jgi:glutamyl-tRNA reductase